MYTHALACTHKHISYKISFKRKREKGEAGETAEWQETSTQLQHPHQVTHGSSRALQACGMCKIMEAHTHFKKTKQYMDEIKRSDIHCQNPTKN